jgi:hypothetical protein
MYVYKSREREKEIVCHIVQRLHCSGVCERICCETGVCVHFRDWVGHVCRSTRFQRKHPPTDTWAQHRSFIHSFILYIYIYTPLGTNTQRQQKIQTCLRFHHDLYIYIVLYSEIYILEANESMQDASWLDVEVVCGSPSL